VDVAEYEKVSYLGALEGEDRHADPPHMAATRRHSKQFLAMKTVEPHLAADAIAFLDHRQNVRCVFAERLCYEVDIASKLVMANECWSKRATESETFVEDDRYESLVRMVPQFLVENSDHFFLRRKDKALKFERGFIHGRQDSAFMPRNLEMLLVSEGSSRRDVTPVVPVPPCGGATRQLERPPTRRGALRRPEMLNSEAPIPAPAPVRGHRIDT
jgi:hypothetical protein